MTQIKKITDKQGNDIYLRTHTKAVIDDNGYTAESRMQAMQDEINQAQLEVGSIPSDLVPTYGSTNWVTSGGIYNKIDELKNDNLSFIGGDFVVSTNNYTNIPYVISTPDKKWYSANSGQASKVIPIPEEIKQIKLTPTSSVMMWSLLSDYIEPSRTGVSVQTIATGLDARYSANEETTITYLSNAKYLVVRSDTGEEMAECPSIVFTYIGTVEEKINDSAKKILNRCSIVQYLYTDHTNNGVVASANIQYGYLYKVNKGDKIIIYDTNTQYGHRWGFFDTYPYVGAMASSFGVEQSETPTVLKSTSDGYLMINCANSFPPVMLYRIDSMERVSVLEEKDRMNIEYKYQLPIDTSYLTSLTNSTISEGIITIAEEGTAQSSTIMSEDEVLILVIIKPTSNIFDIRFGRYNASNGTLVGLRKDSNGSFLDLYKGTTLVSSIELDFELLNGVEYYIKLKKITCNNTYIEIDINSNNGYNYHLLNASPEREDDIPGADTSYMIGKMWGIIYCNAHIGTCTVSELMVRSPYNRDCSTAVIGHSFVEGNSIEGMKMSKFTKLLQNELGIEECGVFGIGGSKTSRATDLLQNYVGVFYRPKYTLFCTGTNDNTMTLASFKTWQSNIISICKSIDTTPVFFTIPPDGGSYEGQWSDINSWIRTCGEKYVDMDKCFTNNGSVVSRRYLYDGTHPNPETHRAIYNRVLQDIPEILSATESDNDSDNTLNLSDLVPDYIVTNPSSVDLTLYAIQTGTLGSGKQWVTSKGKHRAIPVQQGDKYVITGDGQGFWGWLTDSYSTPVVANSSVPYVNDYDRVLQDGGICVTVPDGASYLVITVENGSGTHSDMSVYTVDDYVWKHSNELVKFKMATWNIGCFKYYNYKTAGQTSDISDANADAVALEYRQMINKIGADILGVCEYAPKYPRASSSGITRDIILSCFKNAYIGTHYSMASCNAVFFNPFVYVSTSEKVFTRTVKKEVDSSAAQRYYKDVVLNIAGIMVHVVEVHLDHSYTEIRTSQMQEVISDMNVYDHVIIAGDFNTNDLEHLDTETGLFTSAGYVIANNGYIGLYQTNEDGHKIDNIAAKGFAMSNIQVFEEAGNLSDHWIVSCDLTMIN